MNIIAFSAGVVGASQLALIWQRLGGQVACLIALDGWGVPLWGDFPIYRLSHDEFTYRTSHWLGGQSHFWATPSVEHLQLWAAPSQVRGTDDTRRSMTASNFINRALVMVNQGQ